MDATATPSPKFKISIPKAARDLQQWEAGQELAFILKGKAVLVMPVPELAELADTAKRSKNREVRDRKDRH